MAPEEFQTEIKYTSAANVMNKRYQAVAGWNMADTPIVVNLDDTAIMESSECLKVAIRAFSDPRVGLIATTKWVERVEGNSFVAGFWNMIGNLYLTRHTFEIIASFFMDGGFFVASGRFNLIRRIIVQDERFQKEFLDEYLWQGFFKRLVWLGKRSSGFQSFFDMLCKKFECITLRGIGPVQADDDNFITRWVINEGWNVAVESSPEARIITRLGGMDLESSKLLPAKFLDQCHRWSRTTLRQNPEALLSDLTIWMKWPITTWMTYIPWLYNTALAWDFAIIWTFTRTTVYTQSSHRVGLLTILILSIWGTKLIKVILWYWYHPQDLRYILFHVAFSYFHSLIKFYTMATVGDLSWSGRKNAGQSKLDTKKEG
ncbi:Glycosyltransferase family 2 protein [Pyrenophora tritici-repentis]|nr:Glycosyltransferase family 2 protein [Pyrenophora tritici-repentis]